MNDDDLGRLLSGAFDAEASARVGEHVAPPPPRFATEPTDVPHRRRMWAPLLAAAAVIAVVGSVAAIRATSSGPSDHPAADASATTKVHVRLQQEDGVQVGVGMPVIAYFSDRITDARALAKATTVKVDGKPVAAAWYFEVSKADPGYPIEGHLRPKTFWTPHADVRIAIAARGKTAGTGMTFGNDLSLHLRTGAQMLATVDDATHRLTVQRDGTQIATYPVSLGSGRTPTLVGTKVIMEKASGSICMTGPTHQECGVRDAMRLTYSGEYLHAAPWNIANIGKRDTSNGCTNLLPVDAAALYKKFEIGDVVEYPNATGPEMKLGSGYGDWNVPWSLWVKGGLVRTA